MSSVTQEEAREWIKVAQEGLKRRQEKIDAGKAEQATWQGRSLSLMGLGRALFLHGDPIERVRDAFREAAKSIETVFVMAYDKGSPTYLGNRSDPTTVTYTSAIDGLNAALMARDFTLAARLARWIPAEPTNPSTPVEVRLYTRALQQLLLGKPEQARDLSGQVLSKHKGKAPKSGFARNYYTLALALSGITEKSNERFNDGLQQQADFYAGLAHGENEDTPEEHIGDHLVALGNLGVKHGLKVKSGLPFLPQGLLITGGGAGR